MWLGHKLGKQVLWKLHQDYVSLDKVTSPTNIMWFYDISTVNLNIRLARCLDDTPMSENNNFATSVVIKLEEI